MGDYFNHKTMQRLRYSKIKFGAFLIHAIIACIHMYLMHFHAHSMLILLMNLDELIYILLFSMNAKNDITSIVGRVIKYICVTKNMYFIV